jgi:hypothetical protein
MSSSTPDGVDRSLPLLDSGMHLALESTLDADVDVAGGGFESLAAVDMKGFLARNSDSVFWRRSASSSSVRRMSDFFCLADGPLGASIPLSDEVELSSSCSSSSVLDASPGAAPEAAVAALLALPLPADAL